MTGPEPLRVHALWFPDWPLRAALGTPPPHPPTALIRGNLVVACTASARAHGVRVGQRRRMAQGLLPSLQLLPSDAEQEERSFLPVLRLIDAHSPGVHLIRPGLAVLRSRGVSRYHGGEEESALALTEMLAAEGMPEARIGIADGVFTAEIAARSVAADQGGASWRIVPTGQASQYLSPLPVQVLGDDDLASLLIRLGVSTLGAFAALGALEVRTRFGEHGARLHALAGGADSRALAPRPPDPELAREVEFESPLGQADQVAFAVRQTADAVLLALADASVVCTEARIELTDDDGRVFSRSWLHPTCFDAPDLVDRVRWQLEALVSESTGDEDAAHAFRGIIGVRIMPVAVDDAAHHQPGLFGSGTDERLHHAVSRVQTLLGHQGVVTAAVSGGRLLADRQVLTPWGERSQLERDPAQPWPGRLPGPLPAEVFSPLRPVRVADADGAAIVVDARGTLSAAPALLDDEGIVGWAGPWPLREHRWDPDRARAGHRFQLVDRRQRAWLVLHSDGSWWAEGRYR